MASAGDGAGERYFFFDFFADCFLGAAFLAPTADRLRGEVPGRAEEPATPAPFGAGSSLRDHSVTIMSTTKPMQISNTMTPMTTPIVDCTFSP